MAEQDEQQAGTAPEKAQQKRSGVRIGVGSFCCWLFLLCVAVPLSYLGGIMVGRGQEAAKRNDVIIAMQHRPADPSLASDGVIADDSGQGKGILGAEELSFARSLRLGPGEKLQSKARQMAPAVEPGTESEPKMAPGMSPAVPQGPPQPPAQKAELYDFIYQTAAFRSQSQAEALRVRMEQKGYRCRIEQSGRLWLLLARVRGPADKFDDVRKDMQSLGLGVPMERSRKAVFVPRGQR